MGENQWSPGKSRKRGAPRRSRQKKQRESENGNTKEFGTASGASGTVPKTSGMGANGNEPPIRRSSLLPESGQSSGTGNGDTPETGQLNGSSRPELGRFLEVTKETSPSKYAQTMQDSMAKNPNRAAVVIDRNTGKINSYVGEEFELKFNFSDTHWSFLKSELNVDETVIDEMDSDELEALYDKVLRIELDETPSNDEKMAMRGETAVEIVNIMAEALGYVDDSDWE